tara:strand:+ start:2257 stop:5379 length:3123 start_codon:yes stop_codon:yes gene_type:complete
MANIRTIDYKGFASASDGTGPKGWMMWSGSEELSGSSYSGVGMELVAGSESYLKFDASSTGAELDIKAKKFFIGTPSTQYISGSSGNIEISSSLFHLDPANSSLIIGAGTTINADLSVNNLFVPAGATASNAKAYISSSGVAKFSGDGAGNYNVDFTPGTSSIAGWTISSDRLQASNLIINSDGNIQTTNFQSSLIGTGQGWKIGSDGVAEFEEARIRGTLSTAVFEKDTISAVGGAVIIANATTISGSDIISTNTTFSVESSNGFVVGEYLVAKATSSTGFTEETFKIESTGSGTLMVSRSGAIPTMSSGQVIVSKAASGSGYILLNGSSGDYAPYMEMVERTGSGVDDLETKVLLGNLGSLGSSTGFGDLTGQTGLYTDNVYLKGAISASSGEIGGVSIASDKLYIGNGTHNNINTGFYVDSQGNFSLQDKLSWNVSTERLSIAGESNGFNTIFYEDFSTYASMSDMTSSVNNPKTDGSGEGWYIASGVTASRAFKTDEGHIKGSRSLQLGDGTTSNTRTWMVSNQLIPLNSSSLYEIEVRIKADKIGSSAQSYIGINGYALDGTTHVNIGGTNTTSGQHYVALSGVDIGDTDWTIYKGYFKGRAASSNGSQHNNITDPATLHTDVEYISPLMITNYQVSSVATTNIDYIRISEFQSGGGSTRISGDNISTGKIRSNNWATSSGTEMDLNGEKITFGGSNVGTSTQGLVIDGQNSNLKFYGNSTASILTIDDNVDGSNPGIKIEDGVLQINRTTGLSTNEAVAYIKQSNSGNATSNDLGLYVGVTDGTLDSNWSSYEAVTAASYLGRSCGLDDICYDGGTKIGAVIKASASLATGNISKNNAIAIIADASAYAGYSYSFFGKGKLYNDGGDEGGMFITSSAGHYTAHLKHGSTSEGYVLKLEASNVFANGRFISFQNPNGEAGYIRQSATGATYYNSSDIRLKKNIITTEKGLVDLLNINVRDFKWKSNGEAETGFIAQELNKVLPELVDTSNPDRWFVNPQGLIPILVKGVQDQQLEIDNMKKQISELMEMAHGSNK